MAIKLRLPLLIWLGAMLIAGVIVSRATYTTDFSAFLPQAPTPEQRLLVQQLREGVISRLLLVAIEGGDSAQQRAQLSRQLAAQLRTDSQFVAVENGEPVNRDRDGELLLNYRYVLNPALTSARFTVEGLRSAIADSIDNLASPAGLAYKALLPRDPTGELLQLLEQLADARQPHAVDGVWFSENGQRALLLVQTRASGADTDGQQAAVMRIRAAFSQVSPSVSAAALPALQLAGPGVFSVNARASIEHAAKRLSALGFGLTVVMLLLIYRAPLALLLGLLPVLSGVLAGISAVALGFGEVHGITLGFGSTLIGEAVDYGIYLFTQTGAGGVAQWQKKFWPTIRLGVATSVCGFAALLFSGFPGLAQLGVYSVAGLLAAALTTRHVLPVLIPASLTFRDTTSLGLRLLRCIRVGQRFRAVLLAIGVAAVAVLAANHAHLLNRDLAALSPVSGADQQLDAELRRDLRAPDVRYLIVVSRADSEAALQGAELATPVLQQLVERKVIAGFESPARYLPSAATQQMRRAQLPDTATLTRNLQQALADLPVQAARLQPFVADVQLAKQAAPLTRAQLTHTSLATAVDALLLQHDGGSSALLPLQAGADGIDAAAVRAALAAARIDGAVFLDLKAESDRLYSGYLQEVVWLSLAGAVAIVVLLRGSLGSMAATLRVLIPLLLTVLTVAAALVACGQPLTLLHLVGLLLVVAIGSNYGLFFAGSLRAANASAGLSSSQQVSSQLALSPSTVASLFVANATTVAGFGVLALSPVPVLQALGIVVAPGAILALWFAAMLSAPASPRAPHQEQCDA